MTQPQSLRERIAKATRHHTRSTHTRDEHYDFVDEILSLLQPSEEDVIRAARAIAAAWFAKVKHPVDPETCSYSEDDLRSARAALMSRGPCD